MNKRLLLAGLLIIVGYGTVSYFYMNRERPSQPEVSVQAIEPIYTPPTPEEILKLVNEERKSVGVASLEMNSDIQKSAQLKADDMHDRDYFQHNVLGTEYTLTDEMAALILPLCSESSENIRRNGDVNSSEAAFNAWKASKPHYEAMVNPDYTLTGIGIAEGKIVQKFCIAH